MTAEGAILHCKCIFARHRIPKVVITDNGSQFEANAFRRFSREFQLEHITSSPYYPRTNGEAERDVKTMKSLFKREGDPSVFGTFIVSFSTPFYWLLCGELLMNRKLRTNIPSSRKARKPVVPDSELLAAREEELRQKQKWNFAIEKRKGL